VHSDSSSASSQQHSRRVGFKNNVAVYHFDSDGEDSAGYSSTVSETSEQLDGHPRTYAQRQRQRRQSAQHVAAPSHRVPAASHDAAASWAAARGRFTAGPPRYAADGHCYSAAADNAAPVRLRPNAATTAADGRPQLTTVSRTMHVAEYDDDGERRRNGSFGNQTSTYDHRDCDHTHSQRHLPSDEGWVLSCGLVAVDNPLFIDRAHYEYIQVGRIRYM